MRYSTRRPGGGDAGGERECDDTCDDPLMIRREYNALRFSTLCKQTLPPPRLSLSAVNEEVIKEKTATRGGAVMMNSGDRLLVVKAGGLRKLISKVEEAFLGVDDEIGAGFDTMPLSAADKTSSPQSAPTPPPTAAAPLPKHAAPTAVGTSAPGLIAAPKLSLGSWENCAR